MVVGTPTQEPWHVTAHLDEESRLADIPELMPTLVRWAPPPGAPPHLAVSLERIEQARRGETLFVVAEDAAPAPLLERVNDARHKNATIVALDQGDPELDGLAHESLAVPRQELASPVEWAGRAGLLNFDSAQHLVSAAAGAPEECTGGRRGGGMRARLARLLDTVAGTPTG